MKIVRYILMPVYRVWFYVLVGLPIVVLMPLLILTTISEKTYNWFFKLARLWAAIVLYGMGFFPKIKRLAKMDPHQSYMLVANHTSMTDIMMMLLISKNPFVFVGKKELAKIPLFGFFYKRTCILVDRSNPKSRKAVFDRARQRMEDGVGICIFPEGGVPDDTSILLDTFKDGAFRLAIEHQIPVLPVTLFDNKKRFPFEFFKGSPGKMRAIVHPSIPSTGMTLQDDKVRFRESIRQIILQSLEQGS
ncbi:lysophospholipid acyltransferase family protein [Nonlabens sp. SY33080]|uniref:lysophospholipid acyltransferase family protein n=1 Tax=Nonlabens sp. SY33080 TaxID=2719911 RepID=UPI001F0F5F81|nr:lysophospholipid acyltransferase family protein [Nonlabens sp. SY33080]